MFLQKTKIVALNVLKNPIFEAFWYTSKESFQNDEQVRLHDHTIDVIAVMVICLKVDRGYLPLGRILSQVEKICYGFIYFEQLEVDIRCLNKGKQLLWTI